MVFFGGRMCIPGMSAVYFLGRSDAYFWKCIFGDGGCVFLGGRLCIFGRSDVYFLRVWCVL